MFALLRGGDTIPESVRCRWIWFLLEPAADLHHSWYFIVVELCSKKRWRLEAQPGRAAPAIKLGSDLALPLACEVAAAFSSVELLLQVLCFLFGRFVHVPGTNRGEGRRNFPGFVSWLRRGRRAALRKRFLSEVVVYYCRECPRGMYISGV